MSDAIPLHLTHFEVRPGVWLEQYVSVGTPDEPEVEVAVAALARECAEEQPSNAMTCVVCGTIYGAYNGAKRCPAHSTLYAYKRAQKAWRAKRLTGEHV